MPVHTPRRRSLSLAILAFSAFVSAALAPASDAAADPARDFFSGRTITYVVATKAGGGYDAYARLIAPFLEKHLPGSTVRIANVPGAGHLVGLRRMAEMPPDGLTIATFNTGLIYAQLLGLPGMRVDLRSLSWIGKAASDPRIMVVAADGGIDDLADLRHRERPALFATAGVGSASNTETLLLSGALGLDAEPVTGFSGGEAEMSILRGEIDGVIGSYSSLLPFVDAGNGRVLLRMGRGVAELDEIPSAADRVRGGEEQRAIVSIMETLTELGRLTAGPAGIPAPRLAVLREAYAAALADPELLAEADRMRLRIDARPGGWVAERIDAALSQPPAVMTEMRRMTATRAD